MALAHAGIPMSEMISAIAIGKADKTLIVDVDYDEEHFIRYINLEYWEIIMKKLLKQVLLSKNIHILH